MVHKKTNMESEILLSLLCEQPKHIRRMAREMAVAHSTVLRHVGKLVKENVLEVKEEGRNKAVSIKRTLPAKSHIMMAENYKLGKLIATYPEMSIILKEIIPIAKSSLIILFGSYAKFRAKPDSDIDIFVETQDRKIREKVKLVDGRINAKIGEFDLGNNLIKEIIKSHVIIKGVERFYEKTGVFQ